MTSEASVEERLAHYRLLFEGTLANYLPDREPRRHLYELIRSYPSRRSKRLRSSLCLASAGAFGGAAGVEATLMSATAIEMLHDGFLVHDDVVDRSLERRGYPTLHAEYGMPLALNAGDAMFVLALRPILENLGRLGASLAYAIALEIEHMVLQSVEGQAIELGWVHENDCTLVPEDYLRMCLKKTCWYTTIHPCRIGAMIGSGGEVRPDGINRFGYFMGAAFQIQDDLLNLLGERARYGKEIAGDLLEGKRTLMLIHLLKSARARDRAWLGEFLSQPREARSAGDVRRVFTLMEKLGSLEFGATCARFLAGAALAEFDNIYGGLTDSPDKQFIYDLVLYMIERDL